MTTRVFIRGLRLQGRHGVLPQERCVGATFVVDLDVEADVRGAMVSDELSDTVSYADLCEEVRRQMLVPSSLVENVAYRIVGAVFCRFETVASVRLRVTKQNPPMHADCEGAGVAIDITRREWQQICG